VGGRRVSEVSSPSHKVFLFDSAQWSGARPTYWAFEHARPPMLFADGSAHARATRRANDGFTPLNPTAPFALQAPYQPAPWEPPTSTPVTHVRGKFYFTRSGLRGRDYDALEVPVTP
jgi:hypothetical protein